MNFHEIQKIAKDMGISPYRVRKTDLIRSIQRAENNIDCYGTERVKHCHEDECCWRDTCFYLTKQC